MLDRDHIYSIEVCFRFGLLLAPFPPAQVTKREAGLHCVRWWVRHALPGADERTEIVKVMDSALLSLLQGQTRDALGILQPGQEECISACTCVGWGACCWVRACVRVCLCVCVCDQPCNLSCKLIG